LRHSQPHPPADIPEFLLSRRVVNRTEQYFSKLADIKRQDYSGNAGQSGEGKRNEASTSFSEEKEAKRLLIP
jgi:hypothetical protein